jgi:anti-sigma B factor antagonist
LQQVHFSRLPKIVPRRMCWINEESWVPMEQYFRIEERTAGDMPVVAVAGEIDVATAPQLRECLHGVIGVLVGALKRCRELGGELHVVVVDPRIMKIFEITGLTKVFTIADTLDAAGAA